MNKGIEEIGSPCLIPREDLIQGDDCPLIRKENKVELMQALIQEIQLERKFILVKVAKIGTQLRVS